MVRRALFLILALSGLAWADTGYNPPSVTVSNSDNSIKGGAQEINFNTNLTVTRSGSKFIIDGAAGGGGGGSSTLAVQAGAVKISSPTANIIFNSQGFTGRLGSATTAYINLNPSTTDFIHNQTTPQSATYNVSSGTLTTQLNIGDGGSDSILNLNVDATNSGPTMTATGNPILNGDFIFDYNTAPGQLFTRWRTTNLSNGTNVPGWRYEDSSGNAVAAIDQGRTFSKSNVVLYTTGTLVMYDGKNNKYSGIAASNTVTTSTVWSLPAADGTNGQCLQTNGNAAFLFGSCGAGGGGDAVLASTQTWAGMNVYTSTNPFVLRTLSASLPLQLDANKNVTAVAVDLSGSQATGIMAAARMPAHTGDITSSAGAVATTAAAVQGNIKAFSSAITVTGSSVTANVVQITTINVTNSGTPIFPIANSPINVADNVNTSWGANMINRSNGNAAASYWSATSDLGGATSNYMTMGITSSHYAVAGFSIVAATAAFIYSSDSNLELGSAINGTQGDIVFGTNSPISSNQRMKISSTGTITMSGNLNISSGVFLNGNTGTNGQVLTSGGPGTVPTWGAGGSGPAGASLGTLGTFWDGGGSVLTTGTTYWIQIPSSGTITGYTLTANPAGSVTVNVSSSAAFGFANGGKICASACPALSSASSKIDDVITGWGTAVAKDGFLYFIINSIATSTQASIAVRYTKS